MISLRVISTLLKRAKTFFVLVLFILFTPFFLSAESFTCLVQGESESYVSLLENVLSSFSSVSSSKALELREKRRNEESWKNDIKSKTSESKNEKWSEKNEESVTHYTTLDLEIVDVDLSLYSEFLSTCDKDAYEYLMRNNGLDALFYVQAYQDKSSEFINLFFNGELIRSAWYNTLLRESEESALYSLLEEILLSPEWGVYTVTLTPEDATLLLDGETLLSDKRYLILKEGTHTFSLSSYGYKSCIYTYNLTRDTRELNLTLEKDETYDLFLTTYPFESEIYFNGIKKESKLIEDIYNPYSITLISSLFSLYSYQERRRSDHITLYLSPSWMASSSLMEDKKASFYSSLFYLLLSFGGYTASEAITNYYSENIGSITKVVFTGCTVVSLIELIQSAVDYYNAAQMGL